jgi:hypothetical protein
LFRKKISEKIYKFDLENIKSSISGYLSACSATLAMYTKCLKMNKNRSIGKGNTGDMQMLGNSPQHQNHHHHHHHHQQQHKKKRGKEGVKRREFPDFPKIKLRVLPTIFGSFFNLCLRAVFGISL